MNNAEISVIKFVCPKCGYAEDITAPMDINEVECPKCHSMMKRKE